MFKSCVTLKVSFPITSRDIGDIEVLFRIVCAVLGQASEQALEASAICRNDGKGEHYRTTLQSVVRSPLFPTPWARMSSPREGEAAPLFDNGYNFAEILLWSSCEHDH